MEKEKLFLYKIDLKELGVVYSPLVEDILQMGQSEFYRLIYPFIVDFDDFEIKEENREGLVKFDLFTISNELINSLITSLKYFYKTKDITYANNIVMISVPSEDKYKMKSTFITRDNFDELCSVICKIVNYEKVKEDKREVTIQNEENRAILEEYLRLQEQAKKENEKLLQSKQITLSEIITVVSSQCLWDYDKVLSMTYFRLLNSYKNILKIDSYNIYLRYASSGQFRLETQQEHWVESIRKDL